MRFDEYRSQGFTDDEIFSVASKINPSFSEYLDQGFTPSEILSVYERTQEPVPEPEPQKESGFGMSDIGNALQVGYGQAAQGVGWAAEKLGMDDDGSIRDYWNDYTKEQAGQYSSRAQEARSKDMSFDDIGSALIKIATGATESVPAMVMSAPIGAGVSSVLRKTASMLFGAEVGGAGMAYAAGAAAPLTYGGRVAAAAPGVAGASVGEGVAAGLTSSAGVKSQTLDTPIDKLRNTPGFTTIHGQLEHIADPVERDETARVMLADAMANYTFAPTVGWTAGLGAVAGGGVMGQILTRDAARKAGTMASGGLLKRMGTGAGEEFRQEFLQSGSDKVIENLRTQQFIDPTQAAWEGVPRAAIEGGLTGAAMGGVFGAMDLPDSRARDQAKAFGEMEAARRDQYLARSADPADIADAIMGADQTGDMDADVAATIAAMDAIVNAPINDAALPANELVADEVTGGLLSGGQPITGNTSYAAPTNTPIPQPDLRDGIPAGDAIPAATGAGGDAALGSVGTVDVADGLAATGAGQDSVAEGASAQPVGGAEGAAVGLQDGVRDLGRIVVQGYYSEGYPWQTEWKQGSGSSVAQDGADIIAGSKKYGSDGMMLRDAIRHAEIVGDPVPNEAYQRLDAYQQRKAAQASSKQPPTPLPEQGGAVIPPAVQPVAQEGAVAPSIQQAPQNAVTGLQVNEVPLDQLRLSKDVPQFKIGANQETGVVEPLGGKFDRTGVAPIQVWRRNDGSLEVISGRHRLELARRSGESTIPVQIHDEASGFDRLKAITLDAELNIRDGQGKVIDYVDYFKNSGITREEAARRGLISRHPGKRSYSIATEGGETLIASIRAGQVGDEAAERIAKAAPGNDGLQSVALQEMRDGASPDRAIATMQAVRAIAGEQQSSQLDLLGFDEGPMKEARAMGKEVARQQGEIGKRLAAISGAAKNPALARQEGIDVKDPNAVKIRIDTLKAERAAWDSWATNPDMVRKIRSALGFGEIRQQEVEEQQDEAVPERDTSTQSMFSPQADYEVGDFALRSQTPEGLRQKQAQLDAIEKERLKLEAHLVKQEKLRREREEIKQRSPAAAKTFELGMDAETNLSGQSSLFPDLLQKAKHYDPNQLLIQLNDQPLRPGEDTEQTRVDRAGLAANALLRGADSSLLGLALATDWIAGKGSSLLGKRVTSPQDLATLGAVLRDPRAETFRYFLVKNGKVIYHTAVSSRMLGSSAAFIGDPTAFLNDLKATMMILGADGYYLMHNHPARNVSASGHDIRITGMIADKLPGFLGHTILDHTEFGLIEVDAARGNTAYDAGAQPLDVTGQDPTRTNPIPHDKLDTAVSGPSALASIADAVRQADNVVLVATDHQMRVTGIMQVSREIMKRGSMDAMKVMARLRKTAGAHEIFAVLPEGMKFDELSQHITRNGWLLDVSIAAAGRSVSAVNENMMPYNRGGAGKKDKAGMAVDQPYTGYQVDLLLKMEEAKNEETAIAEREGSPQMDMFAAIYREERKPEAQPDAESVVRVSGNEIAPSNVTGKPLRDKIIEWAKKKWGGNDETVTNKNNHQEIIVSWQGVKHAISGANEAELRLLAGIEDLIVNAEYVGFEKDKKDRPEIKAVHNYKVKAKLGDETLEVGIVVRETIDGHKYYDQFILPKQNPTGISEAASASGEKLDVQPTVGLDSNIPQPAAESKQSQEQQATAMIVMDAPKFPAKPDKAIADYIAQQYRIEIIDEGYGPAARVTALLSVTRGGEKATVDIRVPTEVLEHRQFAKVNDAAKKLFASAQPDLLSDKDTDAATAILDRANVTGKDRLDIMRDFKDGKHSLEDLEKAYPVVDSEAAAGTPQDDLQSAEATQPAQAEQPANGEHELQIIDSVLGTWRTVEKYNTQAEADAALPKGSGWRVTKARTAEETDSDAAKFSQSATPVSNPFTLSGLKAAINSAFTHAKDFAGLLEGTGKVLFISRDEIGKYLGEGAKFSKVHRTGDYKLANGRVKPGFAIIENPTRDQAQNLLDKSEHKELRGLRDPDTGTLYVWDAAEMMHQMASDALGMSPEWFDKLRIKDTDGHGNGLLNIKHLDKSVFPYPIFSGEGAQLSVAQDQTDTPAFKKWFGNSAVVNAKGSPLVVYWGGDDGVTQFEGSRDYALEDDYVQPTFFTKHNSLAKMYAKAVEGKVYSLYLSIQNPLVVYGAGTASGRMATDFIVKKIDEAKSRGKDGVIFKGVQDSPYITKSHGPVTDIYITFRPEQIKSATDNVGTFDPANPDIRYSADGSRILAFVKDGITHFVYDNISQTDDNVKGLAMHEIALHALKLGRTDAEFQAIIKRIEVMRRMGNKKIQAARDRVPTDTSADLVLEEQGGYLIESNPDLPIVQKLIARFRALLRMVGNKLPMAQRMQWFKWANDLTVDDIVLIAQDAMKTAPEALKTAGARGTFLAGASDKLYSQLRVAIRDMNDKIFQGSAANVRLHLMNNLGKYGIKKDEIFWTGLDEFLKMDKKVSKADVLSFLDENAVQVKDEWLGGALKVEQRGSAWVTVDSQGKEVGRYYSQGDARANAEEGTGATKFPTQALPGGRDYRELLITLPTKISPEDQAMLDAKYQRAVVLRKEYNDLLHGGLGEMKGDEVELGRKLRNLETQIRMLNEAGDKIKNSGFTSSHYPDTKNLIAHVRLNTRDDAQGRAGTFAEEFQSDYSIEGNKKGFGRKNITQLPDGFYVSRDGNTFIVRDANGYNAIGAKNELTKQLAIAVYLDYRNTSQPMHGGLSGIPPAPFVTSATGKGSTAHTLLSLKKTILYAIEQGHEFISWTTGTQQKERYSLSKQVNKIESTERNSKGERNVFIYPKGEGEIRLFVNNEGVVEGGKFAGDRLDEVVGKDISDKILATEKAQEYTGLDLDIGGEWADTLYGNENGLDANGKPSLMSQAVKEVARQLGIELKVEGIELGHPREGRDAASHPAVQPSFTITPELRSKVTSAGMPLFSKQQSALAQAMAAWDKVVDSYLAGTIKRDTHPILLPSTPASMQVMGLPDMPVRIKSLHSLDHIGTRLDAEAMKQIPAHVADPALVYFYKGVDGKYSMNFVTRLKNGNRHIVVALHPNAWTPEAGKSHYMATVMDMEAHKINAIVKGGGTLYVGDLKSVPGMGEAFTIAKRENGREAVNLRELASQTFSLLATVGNSIKYKSAAVNMIQRGEAKFSQRQQSIPGTAQPPAQPPRQGNIPIIERLAQEHGRPMGELLNMFDRNQIVQMYEKSLPELRDYKHEQEAIVADRNKAMHEADGFLDKLRAVPMALRDKFATLAHEATIAGVDPSEEYQDNDQIKELRRMEGVLKERAKDGALPDSQKAILKHAERLIAEAPKTYKKLRTQFLTIPQEQRELFVALRDQYRENGKRVFDAFAERVERMKASPEAKASAIQELRAQYDKMKKGIYFPLARFGDFVLIGIKEIDGIKTRVVEYYESEKAAGEAKQRMAKDGYQTKISKRKDAIADNGANKALAGVIEKVRALQVGGVAGKADLDLLLDGLNQSMIQMLPDQSYRRHFMHRKNTPGYSADFIRAYADSMWHSANHIAGLKHGDRVTASIEAMQERIDREQTGDTSALQDVVNHLIYREERLREGTSKTVAFIGQAGFLSALSSISNFFVNLTQTPMLTLPHLGGRYGFGQASTQLLSGLSAQVKAMKTANSLTDLKHVMDIRNRLQGVEKDLMTRLHDMGKIDLTGSHDLIDAANRDAPRPDSAWDVAMRVAAFPQHASEVINRQVTALAAIRLEMKKTGSIDAALNAAVEAIDQTHYDYEKSNRAMLMHGNTQRILFMFKQYAQKTAFLWARTAYLAVGGDNASPEVKKIARKQLAGMVAMQAALSGVLGLPIFLEAGIVASGVVGFKYGGKTGAYLGLAGAALITAIAWATDDDEDEFDAEVRKALSDMVGNEWGEVLARGAVRLTGVDISGRVNADELFIRKPDKSLEGRDAWARWIDTLSGYAIGGQANNIFTGLSMMGDGYIYRGAEKIMPVKALRDLMQAGRFAKDGITTMKGDKIVDELNMAQIATKALGFNPAEVAEAYERNAAIKGAETILNNQRSKLLDKRWALKQNDDTEGMKDNWQDILEFNKEHPTHRITMPDVFKSFAARKRASQKQVGGITVSRKHKELRDKGSFANVE